MWKEFEWLLIVEYQRTMMLAAGGDLAGDKVRNGAAACLAAEITV